MRAFLEPRTESMVGIRPGGRAELWRGNSLGNSHFVTHRLVSNRVVPFEARIQLRDARYVFEPVEPECAVNGQRVSAPVALDDGAVLRVGEVELVFRTAPARAPTPTESAVAESPDDDGVYRVLADEWLEANDPWAERLLKSPQQFSAEQTMLTRLLHEKSLIPEWRRGMLRALKIEAPAVCCSVEGAVQHALLSREASFLVELEVDVFRDEPDESAAVYAQRLEHTLRGVVERVLDLGPRSLRRLSLGPWPHSPGTDSSFVHALAGRFPRAHVVLWRRGASWVHATGRAGHQRLAAPAAPLEIDGTWLTSARDAEGQVLFVELRSPTPRWQHLETVQLYPGQSTRSQSGLDFELEQEREAVVEFHAPAP